MKHSGRNHAGEGLPMIAAIYARKSTEQAIVDDQKSIARQIEHARNYAEKKGWSVSDQHVYQDDGISGAEFTKRPDFLRLMNALKPRPPFQVLIMSEESRLGREAIETAYALKQLVQAGVRVFFYLEDRERTLDSPTDKVLLSLTTFADELEREKTRQRTYDAMVRKAKAGHVTGGRVFGYTNVEMLGPDGNRSHVVRQINEAEAAVVRQIFTLCADGVGQQRITRILNEERALTPRPKKGGPAAWAPSSVREVLFRETYRGVVIWNRQRKRDVWGIERHTDKPESEWMRIPAEKQRIVSDDLWNAAHHRLEKGRQEYNRVTGGQRARRRRDVDSKYLLVGFARCGCCGAGLSVQSRAKGKHGRHGRRFYYRCLSSLRRGRSVCANSGLWPMDEIDQAVLSAIAGDALDPDVIEDVVREAYRLYHQPRKDDRAGLRQELKNVESELERMAAAIAGGATFGALAARVADAERRRNELTATLNPLSASLAPPLWDAIESEVRANLATWRTMLLEQPVAARDAFRKLLHGPIVFSQVTDHARSSVRFEGQVGLQPLLGQAGAMPFLREG